MFKSKYKRLVRQLREIISFSQKKSPVVNFDQKQIFVRYWSYCFINLFFILRPMYTWNGMTILEDIPLVLHSLLKTRKHRLAIISAGSRTKCSQFHYPLHRGVRKGFGNNLVCCKGNWSCLHSSRPFSYHFENHLMLPAVDAFFFDKYQTWIHYFLTRKELNTREELNALP